MCQALPKPIANEWYNKEVNSVSAGMECFLIKLNAYRVSKKMMLNGMCNVEIIRTFKSFKTQINILST